MLVNVGVLVDSDREVAVGSAKIRKTEGRTISSSVGDSAGIKNISTSDTGRRSTLCSDARAGSIRSDVALAEVGLRETPDEVD